MKTEYLKADSPADLSRAADWLKQGELVAVPTETVYGLAADATNPAAVEKIFEAKGRPKNHPLITHIRDLGQLDFWAQRPPAWLYSALETAWPGPLTVVLRKQPWINNTVTGGLDTIGLRVPSHPALLELMKTGELALAAPSANLYQQLTPTTPEQVRAALDGRIAAILDGGRCQLGTESTIVGISENQVTVLRAGPLQRREFEALFPVPVVAPAYHQEQVPGNKRVHYRPTTPVYLKSCEEIMNAGARSDLVCLYFSDELSQWHSEQSDLKGIAMPADAVGYRHALYASLYLADQRNAGAIWIEMPPKAEGWDDIWDRLHRATLS
ncbi:hypothetical protein IDSA_06980 [Pseudidiomarina salinarum]|uniref:Threonylcarbamoyl-AMP synthase n=1 Tax=Pseudidiomarina salinarum TaxID=435908 RepID=A0A094IUK9_9GAMM|nr:L-threonylcarbamoyladenylate synthase [Pseudidiomarina salinarum]KFZ30822.1 hypothetical protein IDSA_06980 [Pseudidiomarina salinarum]RUO71291.1 threonylcarbamoyl-AMP synthase [Pseudidiomarina salinarum]